MEAAEILEAFGSRYPDCKSGDLISLIIKKNVYLKVWFNYCDG